MIDALKQTIDQDPRGAAADAFELAENGRPTLKGRGYDLEEDTVAAVDVALALGRPLLIAGEPGCGKTELGFAVARRLKVPNVHLFPVKSTSDAGELFYVYDALRRFREGQLDRLPGANAGQATVSRDVGEYVDFQALGLAILCAHEFSEIAHLLRGKPANFRPADSRPERSVVIIDEIDKASRDFPNDLLHEIDTLSFRVREFPAQDDAPQPTGFRHNETPPGDRIPPALRPIVIVTSNEERQLPDAFLRRCVFHEIRFPNKDRLERIVAKNLANRLKRLGDTRDSALADEQVEALAKLVVDLREMQFEKKPGIAELLDAAALLALAGPKAALTIVKPALAKLKGDRSLFDRVVS